MYPNIYLKIQMLIRNWYLLLDEVEDHFSKSHFYKQHVYIIKAIWPDGI